MVKRWSCHSNFVLVKPSSFTQCEDSPLRSCAPAAINCGNVVPAFVPAIADIFRCRRNMLSVFVACQIRPVPQPRLRGFPPSLTSPRAVSLMAPRGALHQENSVIESVERARGCPDLKVGATSPPLKTHVTQGIPGTPRQNPSSCDALPDRGCMPERCPQRYRQPKRHSNRSATRMADQFAYAH